MIHQYIYIDIPYSHILQSMLYTRSNSRIDAHLHSYFPRAIRLWNCLPDHIIESKNLETLHLINKLYSIWGLLGPEEAKFKWSGSRAGMGGSV